MDEKLYRVDFKEIVKEMKKIVDDYEKLPQDALKKKEIELLDIEHKEQITTDIIETYKQKMETYQDLPYEDAGDMFNNAKLEYENAKRNLSSIMSEKNDKQVEVNKIKKIIQDYSDLQDNVIKNAKAQNALKDKSIKKRLDSIKNEENEKFRKTEEEKKNLEIRQIEEKEEKFKLARNNANQNAGIVTAEEKMVLDNFANEKQSIIEKYDSNLKEYMDKANDELDELERIKQENHRVLLEFIKVVKDPEKINSLFDGYEKGKEKIKPEESKKAEVVKNKAKQENNNKENVSNREKDLKFIKFDEFLNQQGKQEKTSKDNNSYSVEFNEFPNKKEDEKDKNVEDDKDSKISVSAILNINGFIKYEHVNEETKKVKATEIWNKKTYKAFYNEYKIAGFPDGTKFDAEAMKNLDPLLLKYLERTNYDLAVKVAKKISNHEDLSEFKDLIKYDMTEADKLTRKEKKLCRKIAKTAKNNGLEVKNIEATKGFWAKLLDKIFVTDDYDELLVAAEETKQLEAGEEEDKKPVNEFKQQVKEQGNFDKGLKDELWGEHDEYLLKKAVDAKKAEHNTKMKEEQESR